MKKEGMNGKEKLKLLQMSEISLRLNDYNDIFSSFDPRPYSERALSDDFLVEAKNASKDKGDEIELKLLLPHMRRDFRHESVIRKRLRAHFKRHHDILHEDKKKIVRKGLCFTIFGVILMFVAAFVLFTYASNTILTSFLVILLEPAGWFLFWEGLDLVIFESKKVKPELDFYEKMSKCNMAFLSY